MKTALESHLNVATLEQNKAIHECKSVWVSASAGTGKTHILTSRILRLLLSDKNLRPSSILALTFTRAATGEMEDRVLDKLASLSQMNEEELRNAVGKILERPADDADVFRARALFSQALDDRVQVLTIHGLCQQLLAKFPLESGLKPGFRLVLDFEKDELLSRARQEVFAEASKGTLELSWCFSYYATHQGEFSTYEGLEKFVSSSTRFRRFFSRYQGVEGACDKLAEILEVPKGFHVNHDKDLESEYLILDDSVRKHLKQIADALMTSTAKKKEFANKIYAYLSGDGAWADVFSIFFKEAERRKVSSILVKKLLETYDSLPDSVELVQQAMEIAQERYDNARAYLLTASFLFLGDAVLSRYENLKKSQGFLDFDDLIEYALSLLQNPEQATWVRYKMDRKICHVLLDEAQDTDEQEWKIVKALVEEFYSGEENSVRTFFAVGDSKQSIYRFRGAQPHVFSQMHDYLKSCEEVGHNIELQTLKYSFRSSDTVLKFVDGVFSSPEMRSSVNEVADEIEHKTVHYPLGGVLEVWPLVDGEEKSEKDPWALPVRGVLLRDKKTNLCEKVAEKIKSLLDGRSVLATTGKYVNPSDIMILLRSRAMMPSMVAALNRLGIPNSGPDLMKLMENPMVSDMLALLRFMVNERDDLSLIQVLRSPLFSFSDQDVFALCSGRDEHVFLALKKKFPEIFDCLLRWKKFSSDGVYDFLQRIIFEKNVRGTYALISRRTGVMGDVDVILDTLLDSALHFEHSEQGGVYAFLKRLSLNQMELKREVDSSVNSVRLMTVHGSKGLESPIVFLPDAHMPYWSSQDSGSISLWDVGEDWSDHMFLHRISGSLSPYQKNLVNKEKALSVKDARRLLYVALTRAKEQIYIAGVTSNSKEKSWYEDVFSYVTEDSSGWEEMSDGGYRKEDSPQHSFDLIDSQSDVEGTTAFDVPRWVENLPQDEKGLCVVRASDDLKGLKMKGSLVEGQSFHFRRGKVVHKLLEVLPSVEESTRRSLAKSYVDNMLNHLSESQREKTVDAVLGVMAKFPMFFGENSRSEVHVMSLGSGEILEGQMDRIVVNGDDVLILDYKTDSKEHTSVPQVYCRQMEIYRKIAQKIFPNKNIKTALLWVSLDTPRLDWVE